jgi:hypothetical protein
MQVRSVFGNEHPARARVEIQEDGQTLIFDIELKELNVEISRPIGDLLLPVALSDRPKNSNDRVRLIIEGTLTNGLAGRRG